MNNSELDLLLSRTGDVALRRRAKWLLKEIIKQHPKKVLDGGCGDGFYLYLLARLLPETQLVGVDNNSQALVSAKRNLKNLPVKLIKGDLLSVRFSPSSFDLILLSEVLEHLPNDLQTLIRLRQLLKPGGTIIISVPHASYPFFWDPINWFLEKIMRRHIKNGFWAGIWNQHERLYTKEQLLRLLEIASFTDITSEVLTRYCLPFNHYLLNIMARILVNNKSSMMNSVNKFTGGTTHKNIFNPFTPIFLLDKLNNISANSRIGVSLVASARK